MILDRALRSLTFPWVSNPSQNGELGNHFYGGGGTSSYTGMQVSHESAMKFGAFYSCVSLISEDIATMPCDVFERYPGARYGRPQPAWMQKPNPEMEWEEFVQQLVTSRLIDGNLYFTVTNNPTTAAVAELWPLDPRTVEVRRGPKALEYVVNGKSIPAGTMQHIRGTTIPGALKGISTVEAAAQAVGLGLGAEKMAGKLFGQGAALNVVLEAEGRLSDEAARAMATRWEESHAGLDRAHRVTVLDSGAKAIRLSMTNDEAQFLETRVHEAVDVCGFFHVPPHMIGLTEKQTSWGTGVEQQHIGYQIHALLPITKRIERVLTRLLLRENPGRDMYVKFNMAGLLRGDSAARKEYYGSGLANGWFSINEVRSLEDMNPIPGGDLHYVPLNTAPLGPDGMPMTNKPAEPAPFDIGGMTP